jgi:hypothetical protein
MIKKRSLPVVLLSLSSFALSFINSPVFEGLFDDREIFRYAGLVIYKGGVPYRDVFDHKPPLIYFLNTLNWIGGPWLYWLLNALLVLLATLLFYHLCRKNKLPLPWLLPLLFNLLIRNTLASIGGGMTREYSSIFLILFFCIMLEQIRYKYILLGILTALTWWMQQDAAITLLPLFVYAVFSRDDPSPAPLGKKILLLAGGFLIVTLPLLGFFLAHRSLSWLWQDAFVFNLRLPRQPVSMAGEIKILKHVLHECEYETAFYTAFFLGLVTLFLKHKKKSLLWASFLLLPASSIAEWLTGRLILDNGFYYYLLPLSAGIPLVVFAVFAYSEEPFAKSRNAQLVFGLILCVMQTLGVLRYISNAQTGKSEKAALTGLPEMEYLKKQSLSDYQLYVFYDSRLTYCYNAFKILAPSPWIYHYFYEWYPAWDKDQVRTRSIIRDLQQHNTKYILDCSDLRAGFDRNPAYGYWKKFLQEHYEPVLTDSSKRILWKLQ